jgi:mannose-6-phosphate isomerase-like protein (cupin superfamily)
MNVKNIFTELATAPRDAKANIRVIKLTGDEKISVFAADISPQTELKPHYHQTGIETYQILQGQGIMRVGEMKDGAINWIEEFDAITGDCFTISEGKVHQIVNKSDNPLLAIFCCPENHLGSDRFFVE